MKLQHRFIRKTCLYQDFAKLQKHTNKYNSLQFPAEMNTTGSKTFFILFSQIMFTKADYQLIKNFLHSSLHMLWPQNHILLDFYAFPR